MYLRTKVIIIRRNKYLHYSNEDIMWRVLAVINYLETHTCMEGVPFRIRKYRACTVRRNEACFRKLRRSCCLLVGCVCVFICAPALWVLRHSRSYQVSESSPSLRAALDLGILSFGQPAYVGSQIAEAPAKNYWRKRSRVQLEPVKREGAGIMFFAYGSDELTFESFAKQAALAGSSVKETSPQIPLAIATSYNFDEFRGIFDHIIMIRQDHNFAGSNYQKRSDGFSRQWLTRILYLTSSPFKITLAYDANVVACGPLQLTFQKLIGSDFDFAVASVGQKSSRSHDMKPHNFAMAYKWNDKVADLFDEWFMLQVSAGVALDDQHTLLRALHEIQSQREDFKFKVLHPSLASAFASTRSSEGFYPRETRVLVGPSLVVHENPSNKGICHLFNTAVEKRQIVSDGIKTFTVFNMSACAVTLKRKRCKYHALWDDLGIQELVPRLP